MFLPILILAASLGIAVVGKELEEGDGEITQIRLFKDKTASGPKAGIKYIFLLKN
jgi:hypothetical protein